MKMLCMGRAGLLVGALLSGACGEPPTTPPLPPTSSATRALVCEGDTDPPVLSIQSQELEYECTGLELGNAWQAPSATATDTCEGSVPVHRYNTGDDDLDGIPGTVDQDDFGPGPSTETEGVYYAQYLAWDSAYNIAEALLTVTVKDTLAPVLTLNGPEYTQVECFLPRTDSPSDPSPYVDPGASALDQCYGDLSDRIVTVGEVNKQMPGLYTITYQVDDPAYNQAVDVMRTVQVMDTLSPVIRARPPVLIGPADGRLRRHGLTQCIELVDQCEGYVAIENYFCGVTGITSNEPGEDAGDILFEEGSDNFFLRAEATSNPEGRKYTVSVECSDGLGGSSQGQCTFTVPAVP